MRNDYNRYLEKKAKKKKMQELSVQDAEQAIKGYPAYQVIPKGKIVTASGNLIIDFENEKIIIKKDNAYVELGGSDMMVFKDKDGTTFIDKTGVV